MDTIQLQINTPQKELINQKVARVSLPGTKAPFEVRHNHGHLISTLVAGHITYYTENQKKHLHIKKGIVEIKNNSVSILLPSHQEEKTT